MQISDESLAKFMSIYREEFGEDISVPEARIMASELLEIMKVTCRPIPGDDQESPISEKHNHSQPNLK